MLSLIPSGILHAGVQCFIGNGVVLSLEALFREADALVQQGIAVYERLRISPNCPLILPSHIALDRARERGQRRQRDRHHRPRHRPGVRGQGRAPRRARRRPVRSASGSPPSSAKCSTTTTSC